ncbi:MAG: acyltransferase [Actinomycetota bacterium]|nr:acyltransferase [Actinomycetota bacterium]
MGSRLDDLAANTPQTRDRSVDFLRGVSILAVVVGHWTIGIIFWRDGVIGTSSAIGITSWLWLATWALQVMPIFFFVGGFSNLIAYEAYRRRGLSTWSFVRTRMGRLLRPSLVFFGVWGPVMIALHLTDTGRSTGPPLWGTTRLLRGVLPPGATVPFGPLWFLAVYLVVVVVSPLTIRLHHRFGLWVPAALCLGAVVGDVVGFILGHPIVRWINVALVLLLPHQLGHAYADGSMTAWPRQAFWSMVAAGLGGLVLLTNPPLWTLFGDERFRWFPGIGAYPRSLLGTDVERVSNAYPPTVCFLLGGIWSIGAVMLLRPWLARRLREARLWKATIGVNGVIMTLFLWHMTAYLVAILLLWPLGFGRQQDSTLRRWLERPVWIAVPGAILAGIVAVVGRFERPRPRVPAHPS